MTDRKGCGTGWTTRAAVQHRWMMNLLMLPAVLVLLTVASGPSITAQQERGRQTDPGEDPHARRPNAPPTPRLPDGTPNLGSLTAGRGVWQLHSHQFLTILVDPKGGIPYQPWAKALMDYRVSMLRRDDPVGACLPLGGTRAMMSPGLSMEFLQQPERKRIIMIFDGTTQKWRVVYMDGRPHPPDVYKFPSWTGHAIGRWEGDTLVVDTVGFNEGHWADGAGSPRTSLHHLTEQFTRVDYYALDYEATVDDPGAYTRPWTIKHILQFEPELEIQDPTFCQENNRFMEHSNATLEGQR